MPGLSQLKQFSSDVLALGNEVSARASRGEQPVKVKIPQSVQDVNDSEEFVLGMPEIEAEVEETAVDDDLSDLAGIVSPESAGESGDGTAAAAPAFEAPDMSGLLNPLDGADMGGGDMPDLSMFADEPEEVPEEEVVEEEPEEVSIADMGLDALLAGAGFDEPEPEEEAPEPEPEPLQEPEAVEPLEPVETLDSVEPLESVETLEPVGSGPEPLSGFDTGSDFGAGSGDDFNFDLGDASQGAGAGTGAAGDSGIGNLQDLDSLDDLAPLDGTPLEEAHLEEAGEKDNFDLPDFNEDKLGNLETPAAEESSFEAPATDNFDFDLPDDFGSGSAEAPAGTANIPEAESIDNLDSIDELGSFEDLEAPVDVGTGADVGSSAESGIEPEKIEEIEDLDTGFGSDFDAGDDKDVDNLDVLDDLGDLGDLDDLGNLDEVAPVEPAEPAGGESILPAADESAKAGGENGGVDDSAAGSFDLPDLDFTANDDIPDYDDFGDFDIGEGEEDKKVSEDGAESENEPLEIFDTSEMEGLDFDIPDTDTQLSGGNKGDNVDFDVGSSDDFNLEPEFEIPGFSDVDTVKEQKSSKINLSAKQNKKQKHKKSDIDKNTEEDESNLPPNTLSNRQYKIFLNNLNEYPLNVRLAFEDFMVQDEFTDDAEFEVIEKILNKAPARQVASTLEKMLDTSIPVPRDFEHRSAEEYESYKKSISYQLKNKIIPALIVGVVAVFICIGLFYFGKNCIYKPIKANSLYKQGYVLLQESEYPLSEIKFNEAVKYGYSKKWFFKYARGYREHKQYQRAGQMYKNILYCFKHDKEAGLEYADMELDDLANYVRAEEIVRREVLDYHINDADGILKLGDIFLEWATEKDPSKFESAREQYATLIQLYGQTDLYMSRMMRYFIRTDNLREVLMLKQRFEPNEKSLCSDDWTELSGYLLDKYYGELSPSEEYLRYEIEGLRGLLLRAVNADSSNPIAFYNLGKYFINTNEIENVESALQHSIENFNAAKSMKNRDIYKYIDAYRLLGEHYMRTEDFLQAQEQFAEGISLYITERDNAGFKGTPQVGKIYEDMGDLKYSVSGDYDDALLNYTYSVNLENDTPRIRYRIGYIQYNNKNYGEALGSFMKAGDGSIKERNLLLAMANTLSMRNDDYAAEGYYNQLLENLDTEIAKKGLVLPQANVKDFDIVNTYLSAANNYGVTLYRLAKKTGDSSKNAEAIVQFSNSERAWDALTRNPETLVRLNGSNLAEQNIKYITHSIPDYEPAIYTDISKTLLDNEKL